MSQTFDEKRPLLNVADDQHPELESQRQTWTKRALTIIITASLGVGLCLAIALPLALSSNTPATAPNLPTLKNVVPAADSVVDTSSIVPPVQSTMLKSTNEEVPLRAAPVVDIKAEPSVPDVQADVTEGLLTTPRDRRTTREPWTHRTTHDRNTTHHHFTWPGWFTNLTTTPEPKPEDQCPRVPYARRGPIDLDLIEGQTLFEVARVQTYHSPGSIYGVSCAVAQLNTGSTHTEGSITISWEEGWQFRRSHKSAEAKLSASDVKNDWKITIQDPEDHTNRTGLLSLLAQIDGYVLSYTCYPQPHYPYKLGYVIYVHSIEYHRLFDYQVADTLLRVANRWGLNPEDNTPIYTRQRNCDLNIGHA